jgi:CubicO group peptidase (beta-lactamase class C family)
MPDEGGELGQAFDRTRLDRMRKVLAGHVERGAAPGVVALVARQGEVHVEVIGSKTIGGGDPIRRDTIFRIASMTKPITAAAAMILVEECRLRLDEPVDHFLPELAGRRVLRRLDGPLDDTELVKRPITLRDLLTFRMGFGIVMAPPGTYPIQTAAEALDLGQGPPQPQKPPRPDEWIRRFGTLPLMHQPGEKWMYNTGSDVLGVLIARASGQLLEAFLRERLFEPRGMDDTGFSVPAAKLDRFGPSYGNFQTGAAELYDPTEGGQWSRPPAFPSGGGGLVSTVDDYLAFARMLLNNGRHDGERILSRAAVETMTADQLTPAQKAAGGLGPDFFDDHGWGYGVSVVTRRASLAGPVGQYGWSGGLGTSWLSDPAEGMVGILMTQRAWTSPRPPDICLDFWTLAYQAIDE